MKDTNLPSISTLDTLRTSDQSDIAPIAGCKERKERKERKHTCCRMCKQSLCSPYAVLCSHSRCSCIQGSGGWILLPSVDLGYAWTHRTLRKRQALSQTQIKEIQKEIDNFLTCWSSVFKVSVLLKLAYYQYDQLHHVASKVYHVRLDLALRTLWSFSL